jgi:hypothetical protein
MFPSHVSQVLTLTRNHQCIQTNAHMHHIIIIVIIVIIAMLHFVFFHNVT